MTSRYYTMTDSTGDSGFLPTVTFASTDNTFTSAERIAQLSTIGITGFYEADFADNITTIDVSAFAFDTKVVVATINGVTSIRSDAFFGCTALRSITLDCSVNTSKKYLLTDISSGAFQGCTSLRNLHIPDTVKIIPDYLCYGCTSLELAVMGYGLDRASDSYNRNATIGQYAFANCSRLSYFVVPETVKNVYNFAFNNDVSLALVYILGRPDVSANAFTGAMSTGATYYYDMSKNDPTLVATDVSSAVPTLATKRAYREFTITAAGELTPATVRSTIPTTTYWKGKIAASVTSLATSCFAGATAGADTRYPYMVAVSLPPALTTIGYGAFINSDGASGYSCIVGAFYVPNTVVTLGTINNTSNTFAGFTEALRNTSTTKQIVFQSGPNTIAFPAVTCKVSSAMAIIVPNVTSFGEECFNYANKVQLYSFFQKNAYTSATRLDHTTGDGGQNIFSNGFNKGVAGYTHYLYIPKKITRMSINSFQVITDKLYVTVYNNYNLTTDTNGLGFGFLTYGAVNTGMRFTGTAPTFHLINNYYDANGVTLSTVLPGSAYHVLFPPEVKTINNRFAGGTNLKTVSIPDTVTDISASAFSGCTGLTNAYISSTSNLTVIGSSAFSGCTALTSFFISNSLDGINASTFSGCTSLASVSYGNNPGIKYIGVQAFYNATRALTSIFIPSSVVFIGNSAFIGNGGTNILSTVTFGAGSRLKSIDYRCFGSNGVSTVAAQYLRDLVLPSSLRFMGGLGLEAVGTASALQSTHRLAHSANLVVPTSLEVIPWAFLYADGGTVDISNVYFPVTITTVPGPRKHSGYSSKGSLTGAEFLSSKAGSLIYLPSGLSGYTQYSAVYPFPSTGRSRSYYRTVSYTGYTLTTLSLNGAVAATDGATTTTQIHADIKVDVTVIGDGATSIASAGGGNALNLISVNIPSTVTDICANAFSGCMALAYVTFSENSHLTTIGNSAFLGCSLIPDIQLPDSLTTIGANAFNGCTNLASVYIPYNVTSIGQNAFNIHNPTTYTVRPEAYVAYQLGKDIYGEAVSDYSGYSVSLSQDGKILAIGSQLNDAGGGDAGQVRVYKYQTITDTTWTNYTVNRFFQNGTSPFNKPIVVNGGDALPVSGKFYWVQLGMDINGEAGYNYAGWSVSLNSDGSTVAIGALVNSGGGGDAGHVRVYKYQTITDASWNSYTTNSFTYTGTAPTNKPIIANGGDALPVSGKFYWAQLGGDIDGETVNIQSGNSVSLSSDGQILAIGARYDDTTAFNSGSVRLYKYRTIAELTWTNNYNVTNLSYTGTSPYNIPVVISGGDANPIANKYYWVQMGGDINGQAASNEFGNSVSLSDDGNTVAIGARYSVGTVGTDISAGRVQVYKYNSSSWVQRGSNINGDASNNRFGESVSLNSDGTILAVGAPHNTIQRGRVRVYTDNNGVWNQLGQDIDGTATYDEFGTSVSLSMDGTILAVGAQYSDTGSLVDTGYARIYKFYNGVWRKLGQDIKGEFANDYLGGSVSVSKDGTTVAIGARGSDGNGNDSGMVRVYNIGLFLPIRLHQKLYDTISNSLQTYFPRISTSSFQVIPELQLTNTLNQSKLTISQINNMYIRYRQSQIGFCTFITVSASDGILRAIDITDALSGTTGLVHLDISTNVTSIDGQVCLNNSRIYSVAISKTVTSIGTSVFNGCTNLSYLSFHPDSVCTTIGVAAVHNTNIIDLALPDSLTTIGVDAFRSSIRLSSVCIPKNVTSLGANAFYNCSKLTSVALPASLALGTYGTSSYFNIDGTNTTGITFTTYPTTSAIPHFKLSDYSMPNGIVQNVVDSAVTYIDHRAYAYYPDITLYAVTTTNQTQTAGQYNYLMNGIKMPIMPAAFIMNGGASNNFGSNSMFPLYRSVPDLNVFTGSSTTGDWPENTDDYYILMPGYSMVIYNNLYDEDNLFTDSPTYQYYDNEFGKVPLNITINVANTTSSVLIMHKGRILSKYFAT